MNVCFYVHRFRDRDCWPLARALVEAGHDVYYALQGLIPRSRLAHAHSRRPFDVIVTADDLLSPSEVKATLGRQVPLLSIIFNGIIEVFERHWKDGSFGHLASEQHFLGIMDRGILAACQRTGVATAVDMPYGLSRRAIQDPHFYVRRLGIRKLGRIPPSPPEAPGRFTAMSHRWTGHGAATRDTEVLFLGECNLGPQEERLETFRRLCLPQSEPGSLAAFDRTVRAEFNNDPTTETITEWVTAILGQATNAAPGPVHLGRELLIEHALQLSRTARRLRYVRRLKSALGRRFVVYGNDFIKHGVDARPTSHRSTERKYARAQVAVDFGAGAYRCSIYTRSARILYCGAVLAQLRQDDARSVYGNLDAATTFSTEDGMVEHITRLIESPAAMESVRAQQSALSTGPLGQPIAFAKTLSDVLAAARESS